MATELLWNFRLVCSNCMAARKLFLCISLEIKSWKWLLCESWRFVNETCIRMMAMRRQYNVDDSDKRRKNFFVIFPTTESVKQQQFRLLWQKMNWHWAIPAPSAKWTSVKPNPLASFQSPFRTANDIVRLRLLCHADWNSFCSLYFLKDALPEPKTTSASLLRNFWFIPSFFPPSLSIRRFLTN